MFHRITVKSECNNLTCLDPRFIISYHYYLYEQWKITSIPGLKGERCFDCRPGHYFFGIPGAHNKWKVDTESCTHGMEPPDNPPVWGRLTLLSPSLCRSQLWRGTTWNQSLDLHFHITVLWQACCYWWNYQRYNMLFPAMMRRETGVLNYMNEFLGPPVTHPDMRVTIWPKQSHRESGTSLTVFKVMNDRSVV